MLPGSGPEMRGGEAIENDEESKLKCTVGCLDLRVSLSCRSTGPGRSTGCIYKRARSVNRVCKLAMPVNGARPVNGVYKRAMSVNRVCKLAMPVNGAKRQGQSQGDGEGRVMCEGAYDFNFFGPSLSREASRWSRRLKEGGNNFFLFFVFLLVFLSRFRIFLCPTGVAPLLVLSRLLHFQFSFFFYFRLLFFISQSSVVYS